MSVAFELKQQLERLIDFVYKDATEESEPKLKFYKYFKIEIAEKSAKGFSGSYNHKTSLIRVMNNPNDSNSHRYSTLIHELAHHINTKKNSYWNAKKKIPVLKTGVSSHGKEFYEIFEKLLHGAIDLGLVKLEEMKAIEHTCTDYNKVMKMLENYTPNKVDIPKKENSRIYVYNSFEFRDTLKSKNYSYSKELRAWYKLLPVEEIETEKGKLLTAGMKPEDLVIKDGNMMIDTKAEIVNKNKSLEGTFVIQYDFGKKYTVYKGLYSKLKELRKVHKYLKIKFIENDENVNDVIEKLDQQGIEDTEFEDLEEYVESHKT